MPGDGQKRISFWRDLTWRLEGVAFAGFVGAMRLLGVKRASNFGGWLLRRLGPLTGTNKTVINNLRIAFPDMPRVEREALALEAWERTGRSFAETAVMEQLTLASGRIDVVGMERLVAYRDAGKAVVFATGHLANFEVMASVLMGSGLPCQITYRAPNNPYVDAQLKGLRARYGVRLFAPKGGDGAREILAGLARGESVALMNDQKFAEGPEVQFFGQPVNAAEGPTRLAMRFGTDLVPLSVVRLPGVRFRVTIHPPFILPSTGDRRADIEVGVQEITTFIEDRVREHPADWFWVHKRWPDKVYAALNDPPVA